MLIDFRHPDICGSEISACCLDDRMRKIVIGDVLGRINVFNPQNGALMKSCQDDVHTAVVALAYVAENDTRRYVIRTFSSHASNRLIYNPF